MNIEERPIAKGETPWQFWLVEIAKQPDWQVLEWDVLV
jgi:hypothetical protein